MVMYRWYPHSTSPRPSYQSFSYAIVKERSKVMLVQVESINAIVCGRPKHRGG